MLRCAWSNSPFAYYSIVVVPEGVKLPVRADIIKTVLGRATVYRVVPDPSKPLVAVLEGHLGRVLAGPPAIVVDEVHGTHQDLVLLFAAEGVVLEYYPTPSCKKDHRRLVVRIMEGVVEHIECYQPPTLRVPLGTLLRK